MLNDESNERMKLAGVYCIECTSNGKLYVGSAARFARRLAQHLCALRKNRHHSKYLQNAWSKRGSDAFRFSILEITERANSVMIECEQKWIDELRAADRKCGYNARPTAGSNLGYRKPNRKIRKNITQSPETREQLRTLIEWGCGKNMSDVIEKAVHAAFLATA